ncbi:MAG TPA: SRPBCC family protein [Polyangiaceae bacterium]|nr:SRPBCC family protein [Polyangiaceae bacterium]
MRSSRLAWLVACALVVLPGAAHAERPRAAPARGFTASEREALVAGATVSRPVRFERGENGSYIGGVSYQVVRATPSAVMTALASIENLPRVLPRTQSATLVRSAGRTATVELTQGKAPFLVTYSVHLEQTEAGNALRFWLDPSRPHDVRDVWGFVRVTPFGSGASLVTLAVSLDIGPGIARAFFTDRIERMILRAPAKIREYVEPTRLTSAR